MRCAVGRVRPVDCTTSPSGTPSLHGRSARIRSAVSARRMACAPGLGFAVRPGLIAATGCSPSESRCRHAACRYGQTRHNSVGAGSSRRTARPMQSACTRRQQSIRFKQKSQRHPEPRDRRELDQGGCYRRRGTSRRQQARGSWVRAVRVDRIGGASAFAQPARERPALIRFGGRYDVEV
jgi:hypothetical protein